MPDASAVMQLLLKTQTDFKDLEDDDPQVGGVADALHSDGCSRFNCYPSLRQISYMISAWARMCKILGKEFQQYLPVVMGPLMKTASIKPEVALLDSKWPLARATPIALCRCITCVSVGSPGHGEHI